MTGDPLLTDAEHKALEPGGLLVADLAVRMALRHAELAWQRRRPELDVLRELEQAVRETFRAETDPWGVDSERVIGERDRQRRALRELDRIHAQVDR